MEGINHDNRSLLLIIFFSFWSDVELILLFTEGFTYTEISTVRFSVLPAVPVQRTFYCCSEFLLERRVNVFVNY